MNAPYLKVYRTTVSLLKKKLRRCHRVFDAPIVFFFK